MEAEQKGESSLRESDEQFAQWAKERMREMDAEAEAATRELGLPPERKLDVLRILNAPRRIIGGNESAGPIKGSATESQKGGQD